MLQIDVHAIASSAKFTGFHKLMLLICTLVIMADGYDIAVVGVALPSIMKDMGIASTVAGTMASASVFGMMIGAVLIGTLAERMGRRRAIVACLTLFSVGTAAAGLTHDTTSFCLVRFVAGIGIGGLMPCVVAQMAEFSPRDARATMITVSFGGFPIGGIIAALTGKGLIEAYGWPSVFFAAAFPLLLVPFLLYSMPESMVFLVKRDRNEQLRALLRRIDPSIRLDKNDVLVYATDVSRVRANEHANTSQIFREGRALATSMFWLATFMCMFVMYGLIAWLVKIMSSAGYSLGSSLTFVIALNLGALIGTICAGRLGDRWPIRWVLCGLYLVASLGILMLSIKMPQLWLYVFIGLVGAGSYGGQNLTYAFAGQIYPLALRSIGVGWLAGVGRIGAITAPILLGVLMTLRLPLEQNFIVIAVPMFLAAIAVTQIRATGTAPPLSGTRSSAEPVEQLAPK